MSRFLKKDSVMPNLKVSVRKAQTARMLQAKAVVAQNDEENLSQGRGVFRSTKWLLSQWNYNVKIKKAPELS
jgi:hypothetical protein